MPMRKSGHSGIRRHLALALACAILSVAPPARANDDDLMNLLAGPIIGIYFAPKHSPAELVRPSDPMPLQDSSGAHLLLGFEGGVGAGPERVNVGGTARAGEHFFYVELDPWLYVGGSLGVGVGGSSGVHPVLGVWDGFPASLPDCNRTDWILTLSAGYRYTGVHELYFAPKLGRANGLCFD